VIWNLLTNAIKFSEPGSTVRVRTWREDGTVRASSEGIGRGSTFQVQLPLSVESHCDLGPITRQQKTVLDQLVARRALQGLRLLIVDDEPDGREVLRSVLQHCGADVITVASGPEAILAAKAGLPDLLICRGIIERFVSDAG
jgi:hypothetical protein